MMILMLSASKLFADKQGRMPLWIAVCMGGVFNLMWTSYDYLLKPIFGDGERTEEPTGETKAKTLVGKSGEEEPLLGYK